MKEKILAFLKGKLSGISESYLIGIAEHYSKTITEETQIETTFSDGVVGLLKENARLLQVEGDRRATDAVKTAVKNYQEKLGLDENGKPIIKDIPPPNLDEPKWFTEWKEKQEQETTSLKQKLEGIDKEKMTNALIDKVKSHDKLKDIPASFLKGRNLNIESEDEIDGLVTSIEADYTAFKQEMVENGMEIITPQSAEKSQSDGIDAGIKAAEARNIGTKTGPVGKPL